MLRRLLEQCDKRLDDARPRKLHTNTLELGPRVPSRRVVVQQRRDRSLPANDVAGRHGPAKFPLTDKGRKRVTLCRDDR